MIGAVHCERVSRQAAGFIEARHDDHARTRLDIHRIHFTMGNMTVPAPSLRDLRITCVQDAVPQSMHYALPSLENLHATEERHFWSVAKRTLILALIRRFCPRSDFAYLDVGCGNGGMLQDVERTFPAASVTGLDGYPQALAHCRARSSRAHLILGDITRLAALPGSLRYDVITALDVLEHLDDPAACVAAIRHLLHPGGIFIATVPALMALWSDRDVFLGHRKRYTKREIAALLTRSGLTLLHANYCFSELVPPVYFHRKLLARASKTSGETVEARELRILPGVNGLLAHIARAEVQLSLHLPIPFGTSTYAVGRSVPATT